MKIDSILNLKQGQEVFNVDTGEVAQFKCKLGKLDDTIFIECVDSYGRLHIWPNQKAELV